MRAYWYWPFVRPEELGLATSFAGLGHDLLLHTLPGRIETTPTAALNYTIRDDIPDLVARDEGTLAWMMSRATTYPRRAFTRQRVVESGSRHGSGSGSFDIAHIVYLNYFTDGFALRRLNRSVPTVVTVHDVIPHQGRVPKQIERALLRLQYRTAHHVIVHHSSVGTRLTAEFGFDPARIHLIPWAVAEVIPEPKSSPNVEATLLCFGTLRRNKGIEILLEAFDQLGDLPVRLVIAGRGFGDVEEQVRTAAARNPRIVAELGYISASRKQELFREADLIVLPYTSFSSQSAVLHDAYAHHRPVVVSDVGALGDAVREDGSGWVVSPSDAGGLAIAISQALSDPSVWNARARNAAAIAARRAPGPVAQLLASAYQRIIDAPTCA